MTLATVSQTGKPHVAGVLYSFADGRFYVSTLRESVKARNIQSSPEVAVSIPIRRAPVGPPSTVQFQGRAELLDLDAPAIRSLADQGWIEEVISHGELELDGGCFIRISPASRWITYGLGMSVVELARNPLEAAGSVRF